MYPNKQHLFFRTNLVVFGRILFPPIRVHRNHSLKVTNEMVENVAMCIYV